MRWRERPKTTPEECAPGYLQRAANLPPVARRQWIWSGASALFRVETRDALRPWCMASKVLAVLGGGSLGNTDFSAQPRGLVDAVSVRVEWRFCYPSISTSGSVLRTSATGKTVTVAARPMDFEPEHIGSDPDSSIHLCRYGRKITIMPQIIRKVPLLKGVCKPESFHQ